jgi:hypothetical protein
MQEIGILYYPEVVYRSSGIESPEVKPLHQLHAIQSKGY